MNTLYQHAYINVNNVSDMIAIKQFLCCATAFHYKSLVNEVLSAFFFFFFFRLQLLLFTFWGYEVTKKLRLFELWWTSLFHRLIIHELLVWFTANLVEKPYLSLRPRLQILWPIWFVKLEFRTGGWCQILSYNGNPCCSLN